MRFLLSLGLVAGLALPASAHEYTVGDLAIGHPHAAATAAGARTGAGYLSVTNSGAEADRLRVELHATEADAAGVARMRPVEALEVPPGATVTLAPQGTHVMFMGLDAPLVEGERVPAVLVFEKAGEVAVEFAVEPRAATTTEHDGHE